MSEFPDVSRSVLDVRAAGGRVAERPARRGLMALVSQNEQRGPWPSDQFGSGFVARVCRCGEGVCLPGVFSDRKRRAGAVL